MRKITILVAGALATLALAGDAGAADDARALGGACYWQSSRGLTESALDFRDRVQGVLGFDLFRDCDVREQTWGVTVVECTGTAATPWTLTLRVGFPGGLDRWQACITKIESGDRLVYSSSFFFRYRAQIVAAALLYGIYSPIRALGARRRA